MKLDEKSLRIGAATLLGAVVLRLSIPFLPGEQSLANFLFFLGSGKQIVSQEEKPGEHMEQDLPEAPDAVAVFSPQQTQTVSYHNPANYSMDAQELLLRELNWDLRGDTPRVLIIHTHTTESYKNNEGYTALPNYRTLDPHYNMLAVGDLLADRLEQAGIGVLHDRTLHDHPSYNAAYTSSKAALETYLQEYPDIMLVLDLHRDAYEDGKGNQLGYTASHGDTPVAKMMLVVSAFDGNTQDSRWHENMALALKLQVQMEAACQGVTRPIAVRTTNYNQALGPRTLLVEVGAAGNTQQEAFGATEILAQGIIDLAKGAKGTTLA